MVQFDAIHAARPADDLDVKLCVDNRCTEIHVEHTLPGFVVQVDTEQSDSAHGISLVISSHASKEELFSGHVRASPTKTTYGSGLCAQTAYRINLVAKGKSELDIV